MLELIIPEIKEVFDERTCEFFSIKEQKLCLEHSLLSISKWESRWHIPFIGTKEKKTREQTLDYIRCMTINSNVDPNVYYVLSDDVIEKIANYIDDPMTATTFGDHGNKPQSRKVTTSEEIYYWMIAYNIPFQCEKWHINRLLTLVHVCSIKNAPKDKKKIPKSQIYARNRALNEARKKAWNTKG